MAPGRPRRARRPIAALGAVVVFCAFASAVGLQAQRVAGQAHLDAIAERNHLATIEQVELRAAVAGAESPAEVLSAARGIGMVEPAAVAVVPGPAVPEDPTRQGPEPRPPAGGAGPDTLAALRTGTPLG